MTHLSSVIEHCSELAPGSKVGVVTLLGSLCPITLGHTQAFEVARRMLLEDQLCELDEVVGLISLNNAGYVDRKLRGKGMASISHSERGALVELAVADMPWIGMENREGESMEQLGRLLPHLSFVHFTMNGADDVRRHRKWTWAGANNRFITMGRPGDTEFVANAAKLAGVNPQHFLMGPELPDISSSAARDALMRGDMRAVESLLHPRVLTWCLEHGPWRAAGMAAGKGPSPRR
jgi:nicotinic acid mononucleotide adenylyltransferase